MPQNDMNITDPFVFQTIELATDAVSVLREADTNQDKIVTRKEIRDLENKLYEENAK